MIKEVQENHSICILVCIGVLAAVLLLMLSACRPSEGAGEPTVVNTVEAASPTMLMVATATPEPPTPTSEPPRTATPTLEPVLPPEIVRAFDREQCPDYCWHDLMLGQSEEEVLAAIRNDPATEKVAGLGGDGDYVRIDRLEAGRTGISWYVLGFQHDRNRWIEYADVILDNGKVSLFIVPVPLFPVQAVLDRLGEPELLAYHNSDMETRVGTVSLMYPEERVSFVVQIKGIPFVLAEDSLVEAVAFRNFEGAQRLYCIKGYYRWGGLGHMGKYSELQIDTLPEWCPAEP